MSANLDLLRDLFPRRVMLGVEEVAQVLAVGGKTGSYEQTRRELKEGRLIPGLRKDGGVWRVPLTAVADALDRMVETEVSPWPAKRSRPRLSDGEPATEQERGEYGSRGRTPDALRNRITGFLTARGIHVQAVPLVSSPAPPAPPSFTDGESIAKRKYETALSRTRQFWTEVGTYLMRAILSDTPPPAPTGTITRL